MGKDGTRSIEGHPVVSHEEWRAARVAFLAKEKEFTRARDELSRLRRELPWEKVDKAYVFDGPRGKESLAALFGTSSQLVVYHFMFGPTWEAGCKHCSFWADNFDGLDVHLKHRDVRLVAISRAPLAKLDAFKQRMGWSFDWYSSLENDFNHDLGVSFAPGEIKQGPVVYNYVKTELDTTEREGVSVFYKDHVGAVFHTYSTYARGIDLLNGAYNFLDLAPKGRDEAGIGPGWVKHHDRYED